MKLNLTYFPLPYIYNGTKHNGSLIKWTSRCLTCRTNSCVESASSSIGLCSYGFNYQRLSPELIIGGFLIRQYANASPATRKNQRMNKNAIISNEQLNSAITSFLEELTEIEHDVESEKRKVVEEYVRSEKYKQDFLKPLEYKIAEGLSFVHDYKQINAEIAQNINVILETNYDGDSIEEKVEKASAPEKAIYMASKLLEEKINVARFLVNPAYINKESDFTKFRFHGLLIKYRRIYTPHIETKNINLKLEGSSHHEIIAHPAAVSVIPHTFIDNAIKYNPKGGIIEIVIQDENDFINFSVSSYGPRILPEEREKIFEPFFRGQAAKKQEEEGAGYGLYVSQLVATQHLDSKIIVSQEDKQKPRLGHWTTFSIKIPLKARNVV